VSVRETVAGSPAPATLLDAAAALSRRFGEDPQYSRAGGGNSSVKDGDTLWIKPSGVSLASITPASLMPLAIAPLLELAAEGRAEPGTEAVMRVAMAARLRAEGSRRPSVECVFHALIPRRFVIHTHPTIVNALTCARDGEAAAAELFADAVLWVPYVDPGLPLAREIARRRRAWAARATTPSRARVEPTEVTLLQSHGLIVAGDDPSAIAERSDALVETIRASLARSDLATADARGSVEPPDLALAGQVSGILATRLGAPDAPRTIASSTAPDAVRLASTAEGRRLVEGGPLTPDQIVYAGSWPLWVDLDPMSTTDGLTLHTAIEAALAARRTRTDEAPIIVVVERVGMFAAGRSRREADIALELYLDAVRVGFGASAFGGVRTLTPAERGYIEHWEAEAYRRGVDVAGASGA
jgi:rhamnulokinase